MNFGKIRCYECHPCTGTAISRKEIEIQPFKTCILAFFFIGFKEFNIGKVGLSLSQVNFQ